MRIRYRWDRIAVSLAILFFWIAVSLAILFFWSWFCGAVWVAFHAK